MQCTEVFACRNISRRDHVTSDHSLLAFIIVLMCSFVRLPALPDPRSFLLFLSLAFSPTHPLPWMSSAHLSFEAGTGRGISAISHLQLEQVSDVDKN